MIRIISNYLFARRVCKKYSLKFIIGFNKDQGEYSFLDRYIKSDISSKNFMSIFLHEVGHHVHDKRVNYAQFLYKPRDVPYTHNERNVFSSLEAECFASRFARKTGKSDVKFLLKGLYTYTGNYLKYSSLLCTNNIYEDLLDKVYKSIKGVER